MRLVAPKWTFDQEIINTFRLVAPPSQTGMRCIEIAFHEVQRENDCRVLYTQPIPTHVEVGSDGVLGRYGEEDRDNPREVTIKHFLSAVSVTFSLGRRCFSLFC